MPDSEIICRGTVSAVSDQNLRELQVKLQCDEVRDNIEHFEPYGFSSEPKTDGATDALVGFFDDSREHAAVICVADRRYRITAMKTGEVAIFDDLKRHVYLKREGIEIDGVSDPITIKTSGEVRINAAKVVINCPVEVAGTVTASGDVSGGGISLDNHTHGGVQSGGSNTSKPN